MGKLRLRRKQRPMPIDLITVVLIVIYHQLPRCLAIFLLLILTLRILCISPTFLKDSGILLDLDQSFDFLMSQLFLIKCAIFRCSFLTLFRLTLKFIVFNDFVDIHFDFLAEESGMVWGFFLIMDVSYAFNQGLELIQGLCPNL